MAVSISSLPYGDRSRNLFIDSMVKSAAVLNRFRLVDGVKAKVNVPIFDAALQFGTDLCVFDPQSTATIAEKEMTVSSYKWSFLNCKTALEASYRGLLLKKGQHNPETMDAEFKDWVFDYFAKLSSVKALELAATALTTEMAADAAVIDTTIVAGGLTALNILDEMEKAYAAMSDVMLSAVYGDADRDFKPAFFLGTVAMQHYQIAIAEKYTTTPQGIVEGNIPTYYGMEIVHFPSLVANKFFMSAPQNLVMLTDDYNDVKAIDMKYEAELSSDKIWGQFKLGFSYLKGDEIVFAQV
jgi:hypothetical protein|tara:strand:+ start:672 stop:1562 length:891 start_codon:yes stop_codon:yes gene_type:complete